MTTDKIGFNIRNGTRNKEYHYVKIKGSFYQEDIKILNIYAPKNSLKIHEAKTDRTKMKNKQTHKYSWNFNAVFLAIGMTDKRMKQTNKKYMRVKQHSEILTKRHHILSHKIVSINLKIFKSYRIWFWIKTFYVNKL